MKCVPVSLRWVLGLSAVLLVLEAAVGLVAVEGALHPSRRITTPDERSEAVRVAARHDAALAEVSVTANDGATLRGWSIRPARWNGDAVILLHGQSDTRTGMLGKADVLLDHGYAVLLPDARAHGASGGLLATYGVEEGNDLRHWFNFVRLAESPRCIDGLGESMGAAQLLASLHTVPSFCAVVAESPFASFREASYERLGQMFDSGPWVGRVVLRPAVEIAFLYARTRYGENLDSASPEDGVSESHVPVLLIHGDRDTNLPLRHSECILARNPAREPTVILWKVPGAGPCGAQETMPLEFEQRVVGWFKSHDQSP